MRTGVRMRAGEKGGMDAQREDWKEKIFLPLFLENIRWFYSILFVSFIFYIILCKISAGRKFGRSKSKLKGDIPKYIKQILTDIKGETDNNMMIVGNFNTPLTLKDRSSRQKIDKATVP